MLAHCMLAKSDKSGFIACARGNQGLYKYNIDESGEFSSEKVIDQGHFLDMIYFQKFDTLFLHEDKDGEIFKLNSLGEVTKFFTHSCTNGLGGR